MWLPEYKLKEESDQLSLGNWSWTKKKRGGGQFTSSGGLGNAL